MANYRLLGAFSGPTASAGDPTPVNVGIEFQVTEACDVVAVWWWQPTTGNSGVERRVGIFPATGGETLLGSAYGTPTGVGWQRVELDAPLALAPGSYKASVLHTGGQYAASAFWWLGRGAGGTGPGADGLTNGPLSAPNSAAAIGEGGQQTYVEYGALARTNAGYEQSSYWVDVEITTDGPTPPVGNAPAKRWDAASSAYVDLDAWRWNGTAYVALDTAD